MNRTGSTGIQTLALAVALVAAIAAAALGWQRAVSAIQRAEQLQVERADLESRLRAVEPRVKQTEVLENELARMRKETEDLHRLRGQYQQWEKLKADYAKLEKQYQQLQQSLQTTAQALQSVSASATAARPPSSWIGIGLQPNAAGGVLVQTVVPGGPASQSGLVAGDVVTAVDGQPVASVQQLQNFITSRPVGQPITLDAQRGGSALRVVVTTGAYPR
jgi:C-terminal processing protease CtpA/Prc